MARSAPKPSPCTLRPIVTYYYKPENNIYTIDEIAKLKNITVLRFPSYHCKLNSIEIIWTQVKNYVATRNITFKFGDVGYISYIKLKILGFRQCYRKEPFIINANDSYGNVEFSDTSNPE